MARPPLELGAHGRIKTTEIEPKLWRARCRYRDMDGRTVPIERRGRTEGVALKRLQDALRELRGPTDEPIRPQDKFERAAQLWVLKLDTLVREGHRSGTTRDLYMQQLDNVVLPALGQLRIRECTVGRMDIFFANLASRTTRFGTPMSVAYRQSIKLVVKHVLQQAVKHGALTTNPIRDIDPIEGGRRKLPRGLTPEQRRDMFAWMAGRDDDPVVARAQEAARRADLPEIITLMLGTGLRIGETLALRWCDIDLEGVPVTTGPQMYLQPVLAVTGNIVRIKGQGLVRNHGKTERSLRVVPLPSFVVEMLAQRRPDPLNPEEPVFPTVSARSRRTGRELTWRDPRNVSTEILAMRKAANFPWTMTSHTWRRTAATVWHDAQSLSDRQAADLVGHANISTLLDTYVARGELHPEAAAVMDAAWMNS